MDHGTSKPRGLTTRSVLAVGVFAAAVAPGWTLGDLVQSWTGAVLLDWLITCGWSAAAVAVIGPRVSYRRRDAGLALVPLYGWYLICVLAWRVALLPYRDWEPRAEEAWRARWLTGDLLGYWCAGPAPRPEVRVRTGRAQPAARRTS